MACGGKQAQHNLDFHPSLVHFLGTSRTLPTPYGAHPPFSFRDRGLSPCVCGGALRDGALPPSWFYMHRLLPFVSPLAHVLINHEYCAFAPLRVFCALYLGVYLLPQVSWQVFESCGGDECQGRAKGHRFPLTP